MKTIKKIVRLPFFLFFFTIGMVLGLFQLIKEDVKELKKYLNEL